MLALLFRLVWTIKLYFEREWLVGKAMAQSYFTEPDMPLGLAPCGGAIDDHDEDEDCEDCIEMDGWINVLMDDEEDEDEELE